MLNSIRAIIKFQSTKDVLNLPGRGRVSICVLMHGEEEGLSGQRLSKDHRWRIAEISSEKKKSKIITTCCLGGFQKISSLLVQKQTPAYSVVKHDWIFNWDLVLWSDDTKKRAFWQQPHQMCLVLTANIKSASCPRLNIHLDL